MHIGLPTADDAHTGVIVTRIAAHAVDVATRQHGRDRDHAMAKAPADVDGATQHSLAFDHETFRR